MIPRRALLAGGIASATLLAQPASNPAPAVPSPAEAKASIEAGPAINWTFPVFSDKDGHRLYTSRGSAVRVIDANRVEVTDFSVVVFSGDASERVDTVLLSPQATFFPREGRATGAGAVRLVHDDVEVIGRQWTYTQEETVKSVSLARDVRVTFNAQLNDILK